MRWAIITGVVKGQQGNTGAHYQIFGNAQGSGNKEIGGGHVFPFGGEMLANPGFCITQLVGKRHQIEVFVVGVGVPATRRVQGHVEQAEFHVGAPATGDGGVQLERPGYFAQQRDGAFHGLGGIVPGGDRRYQQFGHAHVKHRRHALADSVLVAGENGC